MAKQTETAVELGVTVQIDKNARTDKELVEQTTKGNKKEIKIKTETETETETEINNKDNDNNNNKDNNNEDDDNAIAAAAKKETTMNNFTNMSMSYFSNEKQMALSWLTFVVIYWGLVMWVPTLYHFDFGTAGFTLYCFGMVAMFAEGASLYADLYPSGASKINPKGHDGRGKYSAIFLVVCILADLFTLAYIVLERDTELEEYFRAFCHFLALIWCSLFYYNRLLKENPQMAWNVFWEEWADIVLTIIVIVVLHNSYEDKYGNHTGCFKHGLCSTYWSVFIAQVGGWLLPMMIIPGWGAEKNAVKVALHLFVLDTCTNLPILIVAVATDGYKVSPIVFADVLWKACGFIRSSSYFMVYYIWLRTGKRRQPTTIQKEIKPTTKTVKPNF